MASPELSAAFATVLPEVHSWAGRPGPGDLASLPNVPAIYLLVDAAAQPIQLATTQALRRLLVARLTDPARRKAGRADLAEIARGVRWRPLATAFEGRWWYYRLAREMYPQKYRRMISFGPAYFLHVNWTHAVPELRVTERVWGLDGEFVGPWPAQKACQQALEGLWDLFDLCRYPEQVRKTPHGTRCAYADMGRCDAPCDGSVPLAAYVARCRSAWGFATGSVASWIAAAEERMKLAAVKQRFELAGQIKQQLAFARTWQMEWARRVRPADELNYLLALPVARRRAWKLLLFRRGYLVDGPVVPERQIGPRAAAWLREQLAAAPESVPAGVRMEQTWLVCHVLLGREADTAAIVRLPACSVPTDLEKALTARVADLRRKPEPPAPLAAPAADTTDCARNSAP